MKENTLVSVKFDERNGRKYYKNHRWKYQLVDQDAIMDSLPDDLPSMYRFYYYSLSGWIKDDEMYEEYLQMMKAQEEARMQEPVMDEITINDLAMAIAELAEAIM